MNLLFLNLSNRALPIESPSKYTLFFSLNLASLIDLYNSESFSSSEKSIFSSFGVFNAFLNSCKCEGNPFVRGILYTGIPSTSNLKILFTVPGIEEVPEPFSIVKLPTAFGSDFAPLLYSRSCNSLSLSMEFSIRFIWSLPPLPRVYVPSIFKDLSLDKDFCNSFISSSKETSVYKLPNPLDIISS